MDAPHDSVIRPDRLLLATDGSEDAMLAARVATYLSLRTGARLRVAHAWYHLVKGLAYPTLEWAEYSNVYEREARKTLEAQVDAIEAAGVTVAQSHILHGLPIDAILDLCKELRPGLVIVGSRAGQAHVRRERLGGYRPPCEAPGARRSPGMSPGTWRAHSGRVPTAWSFPSISPPSS